MKYIFFYKIYISQNDHQRILQYFSSIFFGNDEGILGVTFDAVIKKQMERLLVKPCYSIEIEYILEVISPTNKNYKPQQKSLHLEPQAPMGQILSPRKPVGKIVEYLPFEKEEIYYPTMFSLIDRFQSFYIFRQQWEVKYL
jgi:hypothetical protein